MSSWDVITIAILIEFARYEFCCARVHCNSVSDVAPCARTSCGYSANEYITDIAMTADFVRVKYDHY